MLKKHIALAMCYNPLPVRNKPQEAPAFVKYWYKGNVLHLYDPAVSCQLSLYTNYHL